MIRPFLSAAFLLVAGCADGSEAQLAKEFDGAKAFTRIEQQLAFGPRVPGTPGHAAMASWLDSLARAGADSVVVQRWWHVTARGDSIPQVNVIARFNPSATDRILYLAHWDTRPRTDGPGVRDTSGLVPGANDAGSGVAVLLGVMDALQKQRPTIGVDLLFVDGEDYGHFGSPPGPDVLIGSRYYARNPVTTDKPRFAVLFDMVGDKNLRIPIEGYSQIAAPAVVDLVWGTAQQMGYGHIFVRSTEQQITDDHVPLIDAGIRAIDVIDFTYPPWHTKDDTIDKVSAESLGAVGNVAVGVIRRAERQKP
jgi:hypothetical protein